MRALTLRQPWATLVVLGEKRIETRAFRPVTALQPGDWFAVHASATAADLRGLHTLRTFERVLGRHGFNQWAELPLGALVGFAWYGGAATTETLLAARQLTDRGDQVRRALAGWPVPLSYSEQCFGDYSIGRWGWLLPEARRLQQPVACRGAQGIWTLPEELRAEALRRLHESGQALERARTHG